MPDHQSPNCTGYWRILAVSPLVRCSRCSAEVDACPQEVADALRENHCALLFSMLETEGGKILRGREAGGESSSRGGRSGYGPLES